MLLVHQYELTISVQYYWLGGGCDVISVRPGLCGVVLWGGGLSGIGELKRGLYEIRRMSYRYFILCLGACAPDRVMN